MGPSEKPTPPEGRVENMEGYLAIVLSPEAQTALRAAFPPKHPKEFYHHMTIAFKPSPAVYEKYEDQIDQEMELAVVGYVEDDKGQAVLLDTAISENENPHITLSCAEDTRPVYSNEMIRAAQAEGTVQPASLTLKAKVEFISFKK